DVPGPVRLVACGGGACVPFFTRCEGLASASSLRFLLLEDICSFVGELLSGVLGAEVEPVIALDGSAMSFVWPSSTLVGFTGGDWTASSTNLVSICVSGKSLSTSAVSLSARTLMRCAQREMSSSEAFRFLGLVDGGLGTASTNCFSPILE